MLVAGRGLETWIWTDLLARGLGGRVSRCTVRRSSLGIEFQRE